MKSGNKTLDLIFTKMQSGDSRFRWSKYHDDYQALPAEARTAWECSSDAAGKARTVANTIGNTAPIEQLVVDALQSCGDDQAVRITCLRLLAGNCIKELWPLRDAARLALKEVTS